MLQELFSSSFFFSRKEPYASLQFSKETPSFFDQPNLVFQDLDVFLKAYPDLLFLSQPFFSSQKIFDQVVELSQRAKEKDLISTEAIWMGIYFEQEISQCIHPKVSLRFVDEEVGFGIFSEQKLAPCSYVGEYTGVVLDWKKKILENKYYAMRYSIWEIAKRKFFLDAEKAGNFTRFINHSDEPNLTLQSVYLKGIPRMIFVASKEILPGVQLTFDYGSLFWKEIDKTPKILSS